MVEKYSYMRDGQKIRILHEGDDIVIGAVQIIHEYMWGDECETAEEDGPIIQVRKKDTFATPPTVVLAKEVVLLETKRDELENHLIELRRKVSTAEKEAKEKIEEYAKSSPVLERLDEFINGGITHYFIKENYGVPQILTVEKTIDSDSYRREKRGRLLSLSVKSGRRLTWVLHTYTDGSGSGSDECVPCTSYEEAHGLCQQWVDEQATAKNYRRRTIKFAKENGLVLPEGYIKALVESEMKAFSKASQAAIKKRAIEGKEKEAEWEALLSEQT